MLDNSKVEKISIEVIKTLYSRFENFPEDASKNRNQPFHTAFLKAFSDKLEDKINDIPVFISLASWFHGLNTTLGQGFFEKTAHILSDGIKKEFAGLKISQKQQTAIADIISDLKNAVQKPNLLRENELIFKNRTPLIKDIPNFSADCYFEEGNKIVAIELKTVKPNSAIFRSEKEKVLYGKASLKNLYPSKETLFYIGFPFDPQSDTPTGYDKSSYFNYSVEFKKFFEPNEVLLSGELWDFLSGESETMEQLLSIINTISTTQFKEKYDFLNNPANVDAQPEEYLKRLLEWNLFGEHYLAENSQRLKRASATDTRLERLLNQPIFRGGGEYNSDRYLRLKDALV